MQFKKLVITMPVALALSIPTVGAIAVAPSQASAAHMATAMATMSRTGTFEKLMSSTSFKMSQGMKSYTVKTNGMTHVTLGSKKVKLASLKKGDTVTVKGELEMGTIVATSVVAGM